MNTSSEHYIQFDANTNKTSEQVFAQINIQSNTTTFNETYFYGPYTIYKDQNNTRSIPFYSPHDDNYTVTKKIYNSSWGLKSTNVTYPHINKTTTTAYSNVSLKDLAFDRLDYDGDDILDSIQVEWNMTADREDKVNTSFLLYDENGRLVNYAEEGPHHPNKTFEPWGQKYITNLSKGDYKLKILLVNDTYHIKDTKTISFTLDEIVEFNGQYDHKEMDHDNDSLIDEIEFTCGINSSYEDNYTLRGYILSEDRIDVKTINQRIHLGKGQNNVSFKIQGQKIYRQKIDGNLSIDFLQIYKDQEKLASMSKPYNTSEYHYTDFERPNAYFTGQFNSKPADKNKKGLYENLSFKFEVDSKISNNYIDIKADLHLENDTFITTLSRTSTIDSGKNWITLKLSGETISSSRYQGKYVLKNPVLSNATKDLDLLRKNYTTTEYDYHDFVIPETELLSMDEKGIDSDGNGYYDDLRVKATLNIHQEDDYTIKSELSTLFGSTVQTLTFTQQLGMRRQTVNLNFDGKELYRLGGRNRTFEVSFELERETEKVIERENALTTRLYNYTDFERPDVLCEGITSEEPVDKDDDGRYDELVFTVQLDVNSNGEYQIHSDLYNPGVYQKIATTSTEVTLSEGSETVELVFDGTKIFRSRIDGKYVLQSVSIYKKGNLTSSKTVDHQTSSYSWKDFQPLDAYIVNCTADPIDRDQDGVYGDLQAEITVDVSEGGNYTLSVSLYSEGGYYLTEKTLSKELSEGTHKLQVNLSGKLIKIKQKDGPYVLEEVTLKSDGKTIDSLENAYTTESYGYDDFEEKEHPTSEEESQKSDLPNWLPTLILLIAVMVLSGSVIYYYRQRTEA